MRRFVVLAVVLAALAPPVARAQSDLSASDGWPEFSLGIGYSNVTISGTSAIDGQNARAD